MKKEIILDKIGNWNAILDFAVSRLLSHDLVIRTIVIQPYTVTIYINYPWYRALVFNKIAKEVNGLDYNIYTASISKQFSKQEEASKSEKDIKRFAYCTVQGDSGYGNGKIIINEPTNEVIGYIK